MFALYLVKGLPVAVDVQQVPGHMEDIARLTLSHSCANRDGAIRSIASTTYFAITCEFALLAGGSKKCVVQLPVFREESEPEMTVMGARYAHSVY